MLQTVKCESKARAARRVAAPATPPPLPVLARFGNQAMLRLQRRAESSSGSAVPRQVPFIVHQVLRSPGQSLDHGTRAFFESRFRHDFSAVRIHTDAEAGDSAHAVNALAYTVGRNIAFAPGRFAPATSQGRALLAHELTHVVQQSRYPAPGSDHISSPGDPAEVEANRAEHAVSAGAAPGPIFARGAGLARQAAPDRDKAAGSGSRPAASPAAKPAGGAALCAAHSDEAYYAKNPAYCRDTAGSGSMHAGHTCYREIPTGSGCPSGKHVCFTNGKCDPNESHIDSTAPSIKRDAKGFCDLSWLGWCSIEHAILDVIPALMAEGGEAQAKCLETCETQPALLRGLCMQGCVPAPF